MYRTFVVTLLLLSFCAVGCSHRKPSTATSSVQSLAPETEAADQSAVYSAALTQLFQDEHPKLLVIRNRTLCYDNPDYLKTTTADQRVQEMKRDFPAVDESTLRDFDAKQLTPSEIIAGFTLPVKYVVMKDNYFVGTTDQNPERRFREFARRFPDARGIVSLSRVGFNDTRDQALVRVEFACPLCGFGDRVFLKKQSGKWVVVDTFVGWVS